MTPASSVVAAKPEAGGPSDGWARLVGGGVAEARVVAVTQAGTVKLLLDGMQISAAAAAPVELAAGDRVALQRGEGSTVMMTRLAPGEGAGQSLFQRDGRPTLATFVADANMLRPARPVSPQAGAASPVGGSVSPPSRAVPMPVETEAQAREALLPMARAAMAAQISLPDMFARLQTALDAPAPQWPPALRTAMSAVLGLPFDPESPAAPQAFRDRVQGAGVFYEARMAAGDPQGGARGDVKANVLMLRDMLAALVGQTADDREPLAASDQRSAGALAGGAQKNPPERALLQTVAPQGTSPSPKSESLPGVPSERNLPSPAQTDADGAAMKIAGNAPPETDAAPQLLRNALMRLAGATGPAEQIPAQWPSAAPAHGQASDGQPAARPPLRGELSPLQQAAPRDGESLGASTERSGRATSLLRDVDGALDRLRLLQFASLNDRAAIEFAKDGSPSRQWQVEIPLALPNNTYGALPLMIERDDARGAEAAGTSATWRMRFTTETPELGAVDVAITLRDGRIAVRFWADREGTASLIDAARGDLSEQIESEAAPVEAIRCQAGRRLAPRPASVRRGQFMDVQS